MPRFTGKKNNLFSSSIIIVAALLLFFPFGFLKAATGVPKILNYQGRLLDADGLPLGGEIGASYCFKFSIYNDSAVGAPDTRIWPAAPSTMAVNVKNGIFNAGIGDTAAGGDALDFNFQDTDMAYLNVEVAARVGATCASGDGVEVFENLNPRQRILASAYAINSDRLDGLNASSIGGVEQYIPATNQYGNLLLNGAAQGASVADSLLYLNSSIISTQTYSLFGLAINGQEKFKINSAGDVFASGTLRTAGDIIVNGQSVCLANGTHCPASSGNSGWSDDGALVYLTSATDRVVVGTSTAPAAKLNVYGNANELQFLVKGNITQTKNLTEWRNASGAITTWVAPNGNVGTSGTVYAKKFKAERPGFGENVFEWEDESGNPAGNIDSNGNINMEKEISVKKIKINSNSPAVEIYKNGALDFWIGGDGNFGSSGTLLLDNTIKVRRYTQEDPIADRWTTYSTEDTKDVLQVMNNPSGFLDKVVNSKIVEYKKKVNADNEYVAALSEKVESEWLKEAELKKQAIENLKEEIGRQAALGEDTAGLASQLAADEVALQEFLSGAAEWKSAKKTELDSGPWAEQKKAELIAWKSALPKYTHSIYGLLADDPSTPKGILTYDENDNIIGLDLGGYAGFLNLALKEAAIRLKNLEDTLAINDNGQAFASSTSYGALTAETLFINNTGASNTVNIQTASSTVFNIDAAGNSMFGPSVDSADALRVRNADNTEILFTVDTENNMVKIGNNSEAGSPTTIFVLDSKADAGDPAGTDGAMYYNSNVGKFRCYEGGAWKDCVSEGGVVAFRESYFTFFSEAKPVAF
ncbi:MAG: hypothetical protein V1661_01545 [bacterium]